jgi:hypothetical protein
MKTIVLFLKREQENLTSQSQFVLFTLFSLLFIFSLPNHCCHFSERCAFFWQQSIFQKLLCIFNKEERDEENCKNFSWESAVDWAARTM